MLYEIFLFNPQSCKNGRNRETTDYSMPILFSKIKCCPVSLTSLQEIWAILLFWQIFPTFLFYVSIFNRLICNIVFIVSLSIFSFSGMSLFQTTHLILQIFLHISTHLSQHYYLWLWQVGVYIGPFHSCLSTAKYHFLILQLRWLQAL